MDLQRIHLVISGIVQGVFFRASAQNQARQLKLTGWVRNCMDGSVEITAEGEKEQLRDLLRWARTGPQGARVDQVQAEWSDYSGEFTSFSLRY